MLRVLYFFNFLSFHGFIPNFISFSVFFFRIFGPPKIVQSDGGTEFKGELKTYLERIGIEIRKGRPYYPQSQGKIERSHGTWKDKIKHDLLVNGREFHSLVKKDTLIISCDKFYF